MRNADDPSPTSPDTRRTGRKQVTAVLSGLALILGIVGYSLRDFWDKGPPTLTDIAAVFGNDKPYTVRVGDAAMDQHLELTVGGRAGSSGEYFDLVTGAPGDLVTVVMGAKNLGDSTVEHLVFGVDPGSAIPVATSTEFVNASTRMQWVAVEHDGVTEGGLEVGNYAPGAAVYVRFKVELPQIERCGVTLSAARVYLRADGWIETAAAELPIRVVRPC